MDIKFIFFIQSIWLGSVGSVIVRTKSGPVRGHVVGDDGFHYHAFTGIPYAESPSGELRFKVLGFPKGVQYVVLKEGCEEIFEVPKKPWSSVFDATRLGPVCPQNEWRYERSQMNEDCLILNVYAPVTSRRMAVLVFIHGGGLDYLSGNADLIYGPVLIMQRGVILVTMNFRLGTLGFLSLGTKAAAGNAGLKDILLSLKWVKENIERFGGDPDNVTIGGHSSGAYLAHCLLLSEQTTGLFQKAILISGSALSHRFFTRYPKKPALLLADYLGIATNDTKSLLSNLTKLDAFEILRAQGVLPSLSPKHYFIRPPFSVCKEIDSPDAMLTRDPLEIIKTGMPQNVPVLAGFNSAESLYMLNGMFKEPITFDTLQEKLDLVIQRDIEYPRESYERKRLIQSIKDLYFQRQSEEDIVMDFLSDTQYNYDIDYWIKIHKNRVSSNKVYYYTMSLNCEVNYAKRRFNFSHPGMSHADELGYFFMADSDRQFYHNLNERNIRMIDIFLTYFVNFIKYSDPTPDFLNMTPKWEDCGQERKHMLISEQSEFRPYAPYSERLRFWSDVYDEYYTYVQNGKPLEIFVI